MSYYKGNSPASTVTWTLIVIAISACWAALAFIFSAPKPPVWSKTVHRPSAAPRNASKSLAAALDNSNSFASKSSALQKST